DRTVVPAVIAMLDAPNRTLAADAAEALGRIGDRRAIPFLTILAAQPNESVEREPARRAIARITGKPYAAQKAPGRLLAEEAWRYQRHQVVFPGDPVELWAWSDQGPAPIVVPVSAAESILGGRFAREALGLDPADRDAQAALVSLALEKAAER